MSDLSTIPESVIKARGAYATVRAWHEDEKKTLSMLCGHLTATSSQILRKMQPNDDETPESIAELIATGRKQLDMIEACAARIDALAKQRADLRPSAWGK